MDIIGCALMIVFLDHVDSLTIDHAQRNINSAATTLHNKSEKKIYIKNLMDAV